MVCACRRLRRPGLPLPEAQAPTGSQGHPRVQQLRPSEPPSGSTAVTPGGLCLSGGSAGSLWRLLCVQPPRMVRPQRPSSLAAFSVLRVATEVLAWPWGLGGPEGLGRVLIAFREAHKTGCQDPQSVSLPGVSPGKRQSCCGEGGRGHLGAVGDEGPAPSEPTGGGLLSEGCRGSGKSLGPAGLEHTWVGLRVWRGGQS